MIENLHWEFTVLSRAIAYKNLSAAANSIGISQPQLSRIVARIEKELEVVLLDRSVRRKSGWTAQASHLAKIYSKFTKDLGTAIHGMHEEHEPRYLRIGTLEGLSSVASELGYQILSKSRVQFIELDVYDLNELEEKFFKGDFDLIFTLREPGRKKYAYSRTLGYQVIEKSGERSDLRVMSPYEYGSLSAKERSSETAKFFVSNSLAIRKDWIQRFNGKGFLPSPLQQKSTGSANVEPVLMVGQDLLSPAFWKMLDGMRMKT